jgi:hypothetical protein
MKRRIEIAIKKKKSLQMPQFPVYKARNNAPNSVTVPIMVILEEYS